MGPEFIRKDEYLTWVNGTLMPIWMILLVTKY